MAKKNTTAPEAPDLSHIVEQLRPFAVPIAELTLDAANARLHGRKNVDAIKQSLKRFGQVKPIAARKRDGVVIAGNGRLKAAVELGWTHIAVIMLTGTDAEAKAFAIADNRTAETAEWDHAQLADVLRELKEVDAGVLDGVGFNGTELDALIDVDEPARPPEDDSGLAALLEPLPVPADPSPASQPPEAGKGAPKGKEKVAGKRPKDPRADAAAAWLSIYDAAALDEVREAAELLRQEKGDPSLSDDAAVLILCRRYAKRRLGDAK